MPYNYPLEVVPYNRLSVNSDYDCIVVMLLGSSKNGRLELTLFSVPANSRTVSVILRDVKGNTSGLTAPDSFNTCPMCEGQRCEGQKWIFNVPKMLLWCREPKSLGLNSKDPAFLGLKLC